MQQASVESAVKSGSKRQFHQGRIDIKVACNLSKPFEFESPDVKSLRAWEKLKASKIYRIRGI